MLMCVITEAKSKCNGHGGGDELLSARLGVVRERVSKPELPPGSGAGSDFVN
jgi:hypothetical protein